VLLALAVIFGIGLLASGAFGIFLYRRKSSWALENRWAVAALPSMIYLLLWRLSAVIVNTPFWDWNAIRVYPATSLARGYRLYYGPTDGPVLGEYYGPIKALLMLPTALAATPTGAVIIGAILGLVILVLPMVLIHLQGTRLHPERKAVAWLGFCFAMAYMFRLGATRYNITAVHVDSVALGLGLLSLWALNRFGSEPRELHLGLSATLAALAVWSKLTIFPLVAAAGCYLLVTHGWRTAMKYLSYTLVAGMGLGLVFLLKLGSLSDMVFNVFTIVLREPWRQPRMDVLIMAAVELMLQSSFSLLILGVVVLYEMNRTRDVGALFRRHRCVLPGLAGLFLVPTGILGFVKVGGDVNNMFTVYYLVVAASLALAQAADCQDSALLRRVAAQLLLVLSILYTGMASRRIMELRNVSRLQENPQQQAYAFALRHPEEAYFPWNPLSTLMADGKAYHVGYSVWDRCMAGFKPSEQHIRSYLPARLKYVVRSVPHAEDPAIMDYLPEFNRRIELAELPGWIVTTR
jgi:hypothetical protein